MGEGLCAYCSVIAACWITAAHRAISFAMKPRDPAGPEWVAASRPEPMPLRPRQCAVQTGSSLRVTVGAGSVAACFMVVASSW